MARFVVEIVEQLDLREMVHAYKGNGKAPFHPALLLSILTYGYTTGIFSSRKLEAATHDSVAFRYVAANLHPDHDTLNTFRKRFLPKIEGLMVQVLLIARTMGVLKLGNIALDGTKVQANASRHSALSYGHIKQLDVQLQAEVKKLLALAEAADNERIPELKPVRMSAMNRNRPSIRPSWPSVRPKQRKLASHREVKPLSRPRKGRRTKTKSTSPMKNRAS